MASLYEDGDDMTAPLMVNAFLPIFRDRVTRDLRKPRTSWTSSAKDPADDWVFDRFAARRKQGHGVTASDIWGAHLATTLLDPAKRAGGYGIAALGYRRDSPLPVFTAVEARPIGPRWSRERQQCERCGRSFGFVIGASRHHCRACGKSVCDDCCISSSSSQTGAAAPAPASKLAPPQLPKRSVSFGATFGFSEEEDDDDASDDDDDDSDGDEDHHHRRERRRCKVCVATGVVAPVERTGWIWWSLSPEGIGPVDARPTPATVFGTTPGALGQRTSTAGEPVGQLLGVVGSAFCASVERFEGALAWSDQRTKLARAIADPRHGDPRRSLLCPASFSVPDALGDDGVAYLSDAGFASNLPLPTLVNLNCDVMICLDASAYPSEVHLRRRAVKLECIRATTSLASVGIHPHDVHFDVDAYATNPLSYHTIQRGSTTVLVVIMTLAAGPSGGQDDGVFDPLANIAAGGFCASGTAAYDPTDYDILIAFVRTRLRRYLPDIRNKIHHHRSRRQ